MRWHEALEVLGHAGGVVGGGAAQALDHVDAVPALAAAGAVVLGAAEVHALLGHLCQLQLLHTPATMISPSAHKSFSLVQISEMAH